MTVETLVGKEYAKETEELSEACNLPRLLVELLYQRGYDSVSKIEEFLNPSISSFHSPFLLPDIEKGVRRIVKAIENKEKVAIYGDYDVDGISSTATAYSYLVSKGLHPIYHIPDRLTEGYGLNKEALKALADEGTDLIITVDTGITADSEITYAKSLSMDTVVTDHHECICTLPKDAVANINPMREDAKYPFKGLAGVCVIFKVLCAVEMTMRSKEDPLSIEREMLEKYGDFVTLGTIADVMPMTDENRYIVKCGLYRVEHSRHPGLQLLVEQCTEKSRKKEVTTTTVGFQIAPRINAAGRMGSANRALELLLTSDYEEAKARSEELFACNKERQDEENRILSEAEKMLSQGECADCPFILLGKEGWHHGVVGIVCSRLTEKYNKPTILLCYEDGIGKGSGRSVEGVNLVALLEASKDLLLKFGGHEMAAGLTVKEENIALLKERFKSVYPEKIEKCHVVTADMALASSDMTLPFALSLSLLEPFGSENQKPIFYTSEMKIVDLVPLSGGRHIKLLLEQDKITHTAVYFGMEYSSFPYKIGETVSVLYHLNVNEFMGREEVQMQIKSVFAGEASSLEQAQNLRRYREVQEGAAFYECEKILPKRSDFVNLYLLFKELSKAGKSTVSFAYCSAEIRDMTFLKFHFILDILEQGGLLRFSEEEQIPQVYSFSIVETKGKKVNLEEAPLYKKLASQLQ